MPIIVPIRDLRNTNEISELAHKKQEPIFVTKNGYSDLVVLSSELYDRIMRTHRIDQAIYEAEKEFAMSGESTDVDEVFKELDKKYKNIVNKLYKSLPVKTVFIGNSNSVCNRSKL